MSTYKELFEELYQRYEKPQVDELTQGFTRIDPDIKAEALDHERLDNLIGGDLAGHYHLSKSQVDKLNGYPLYEFIDNRIKKEVQDRTKADNEINERLDKEISDRIADVDAEEQARITAITNEANTRKTADEALGKRIDKEISDRTTAVKTEEDARKLAITTEANTRKAADDALGKRIDDEIQNRIDAVNAEAKARQEAITTEATTRSQADTALGARIDKEIQDRKDAISNAVTNEVTARNSAINNAVNSEKTARENKEAELLKAIEKERQDRLEAQATRDFETGTNSSGGVTERYIKYVSVNPNNNKANTLFKYLMGSIPLTGFTNESTTLSYGFKSPFDTACVSLQLTIKNPDASNFVDAVVNSVSYDLSGFRYKIQDLWDIKDIKKCYVDFLAIGL